MNTETLTTVKGGELAANRPQEVVPVFDMMQAIIAKGITGDNVTALERLATLHERMQEKEAERAFARAFVGLQKDLPVIVASTEIPKRGKYERFEDVMAQIQPHLTEHGFTVTFSQTFNGERITETCRLTHTGGHFKENCFTVRTGPADSATQSDCKASTTAKRNALLNALNIVIRQDMLQDEEADARLEGEPVTREQADRLRQMCAQVGASVPKFLAYAGAQSFEDIRAARYSQLLAELHRKLK